MTAHPTKVLLLGTGVTMLGTLRCLARRGIPSSVLAQPDGASRRDSGSAGRDPYTLSRWYRPAPPYYGEGLDLYLASLPFDAVLLPCSDDWAGRVTGLPPVLRKRFPSAVPDEGLLDQFLDKGLFAELLEAERVPHPATFIVGSKGEVRPENLSGHFFIKPRDSQAFHARFGVKAFWPESESELLERLDLATGNGFEVVVQEYIPGPASNHYFVDGFVDAGHHVKAVFVRRRLRMYPPRFGNSSYMVSIAPSEATGAVESITGLLERTGYRGIFSAEFKKDERDGLFKILEVNARPWWFVEFAANCGVNVVEMAYRDALGETVPAVHDYRVGRHFMHPYYDLSACLHDHPRKVQGLVAFLRALPGADRAVFRWSDPLPAAARAMALTRGFLRRRMKRVLRR